METDVFLTITAQKGHPPLLFTSIIPWCNVAVKSMPWLEGCLHHQAGAHIFGRQLTLSAYYSMWLMLSGLCVCVLLCTTLVSVLSALCLLPISFLGISHHMTNNWPLTAIQPITSQNTRHESNENIVLPPLPKPKDEIKLSKIFEPYSSPLSIYLHYEYLSRC